VSLPSESATVMADEGVQTTHLIEAVEKAGYHAELRNGDHHHHEHHHSQEAKTARFNFIVAAVLSSPILLTSMHIPGIPELPALIQFLLATPVVVLCGRQFFIRAAKSIAARNADMDVLIAIGVGAAYLFSIAALFSHAHLHVYFEAATAIVTLVLLGRFLEAVSMRKTGEAIRSLFELQPTTALLWNEGETKLVPLASIKKGDILAARPGDRISVDGQVIEGESQLDESMLSGESMPVEKAAGDRVFAGTMNGSGWIKFVATEVGEHTALAQIIRAVSNAQNSKAAIQSLADKITSVFIPAALLVALGTFFGWLMFSGAFDTAVINSVAVLIIACPCAMGLATPVAIVVGVGRAAQMGVLPQNAHALETLARTNMIVFDKTGTITRGKPTLTDVASSQISENDALAVAAALESRSEHPIAKAIIEAARQRNIQPQPIESFQAQAGSGVIGVLHGKSVGLGSQKFAESIGVSLDGIQEPANKSAKLGNTVVILWQDNVALAAFGISDIPKSEARHAVETLKHLGLRTVLMTGDSHVSAETIAAQVGIQSVLAELRPEDKSEEIAKLQRQGERVAMVGDGINDSPALAQADVGIAMGSGSDIALETSDITIVRSNLDAIPEAVRLSRAVLKVIKQNLFFAFFYNSLAIPLAALGFLNPMIGAAAMALSDICVVGNALRLRAFRPR